MTVSVDQSNEPPLASAVASSASPPSDDNNIVVPRIPVDRFWLRKLIQKHENDERLTPYYKTLHAKYPILKDKALVVAPMVDQSDLPFRLLCRKYGTNLCVSHASIFVPSCSCLRVMH